MITQLTRPALPFDTNELSRRQTGATLDALLDAFLSA
jgi:hypothetical protein